MCQKLKQKVAEMHNPLFEIKLLQSCLQCFLFRLLLPASASSFASQPIIDALLRGLATNQLFVTFSMSALELGPVRIRHRSARFVRISHLDERKQKPHVCLFQFQVLVVKTQEIPQTAVTQTAEMFSGSWNVRKNSEM